MEKKAVLAIVDQYVEAYASGAEDGICLLREELHALDWANVRASETSKAARHREALVKIQEIASEYPDEGYASATLDQISGLTQEALKKVT